MGSKTRTYNQKKLLGQVYTPLYIVEKILTDSGFYQNCFQTKSILDPACGDGRFLVPVARHIIQSSKNEDLQSRLEQLFGWDIDADAIEICRNNLNELVKPLGMHVHWNLTQLDAFEQIDSIQRFDYIFGNPPYIRIQHLGLQQRKFVQRCFNFCKNGSTDAYIAFFELASRLLTSNGICGYITPNSYLSSETGRPLRAYFQSQCNLRQVTNFGAKPIFSGASTYSAITIFGLTRSQHFNFERSIDQEEGYVSRNVAFSELEDKPAWQLSTSADKLTEGQKLGDLCRISVGITTLADRLYLFSKQVEQNGLVLASNKDGKSVWLENEMLVPVVKGSKLKAPTDPIQQYVLFPYQKDIFGKNRIIQENELSSRFPNTFAYFTSIKTELDKRDNGKPNAVAWYAFGRSQGLDTSFGPKIIFSPMNLKPNFIYYENPDCTIYSGYFIKFDGDYNILLSQLNSKRMENFIDVAGRDFQGGYKGYNKKVVENFPVIL